MSGDDGGGGGPTRPAQSLRSSWLAPLVVSIPFWPEPGEFAQACQMRTRTPQGALLMALIAFATYARSPSVGVQMLAECLHSSFISGAGNDQVRLRAVDKSFLQERLGGRPERAEAYLRRAPGSEEVTLEARLSGFCADPTMFMSLFEASDDTTPEQHPRQLAPGAPTPILPAPKPARSYPKRALHKRTASSIQRTLVTAESVSTFYERHVQLLVSRTDWISDDDAPVFVEMRLQHGRWALLNWYALFSHSIPSQEALSTM